MSKWKDCPDYKDCKILVEEEGKLECGVCPLFKVMLAKKERELLS